MNRITPSRDVQMPNNYTGAREVSAASGNANQNCIEISPYPSHSGCYQEKKPKKLARKSRKGALHTILVGCKLVQTPWKSVLTNHKNRCSRALQTTVGWRAGRTDSGLKDSYDFQRARVEKEERKEDCPQKNKTSNKQNSWARAAAEKR